MKVSYQWLKEWVKLDESVSPQKVADILTSRGIEVEDLHRLDEGLEKVVTAQIIRKEKHPEADRLSLCKVNIGKAGVIKEGESHSEYLDIVCGAQNMKVGDVVALAQIGAHLPNGMKIEKGKIRGQVSMGMLCSDAELGFSKEAEGIKIFPEKTPVGWKIADVLSLDDTILEIKLTANRGDCLSHRGIARELAGALEQPLQNQKTEKLNFQSATQPAAHAKQKQIKLEAGESCPQFFGAYLTGIKVGPSPEWLKRRIESIGQRSINNIVDVSNYLMFELGFPVHIYDADRLEGDFIRCVLAKDVEFKNTPVKLLDDTEVQLTGEELVITDSAKIVALAGVMGAANSEVTETTKNIFLECAEFDPVLVRRAAFRFAKRSEASLRFEKGIDPGGLAEAISRLAYLVEKISGGELQYATAAQLDSRKSFSHPPVSVNLSQVRSFLGFNSQDEKCSSDVMLKILKGLDCEVEVVEGSTFKITPPSYRLDLKIWQDFAEEVARTLGYDQIPSTIPVLTGSPQSRKNELSFHKLKTVDQAKDAFAAQGLSEGLQYAFQSQAWLEKFGFESKIKILNPLSEEQAYMVPSLLPALMKSALENERHHFGSEPLGIRIFEIRPVFKLQSEIRAVSEHETGVEEQLNAAFLISGPRYDQALKNERHEVDFFDLKAILESVFESIGVRGIRFKVPEEQAGVQLFHGGQSLDLIAGKNKIGTFGRIHPKLEADLKLKAPLFWGEFNFDAVIELTPMKERQMKPWSTFPTMERDFALLVKNSVSAENLIQSAMKSGKPIAKVVKIFDTYKGESIPQGMVSIGIRVIFSDETQSLEEKRVDECAQIIVKKWSEEFGAQQR